MSAVSGHDSLRPKGTRGPLLVVGTAEYVAFTGQLSGSHFAKFRQSRQLFGKTGVVWADRSRGASMVPSDGDAPSRQ